ncbi:MAG: ABC transporter permease subunit [Gammaproteobacteria bacterium]|nr:ABC transporter permease subunit [Gammaproteobacteria bacterium]
MSALVVAGRELRGLFVTPFGWIALAVAQFVAAWLFLVQVEGFVKLQARLAAVPGAPGVTDLVVAPLLAQIGVLLLVVMPLVSMRAISGERQAGTLPLLLAAPLGAGELVLGKFLAAFAFGLLLIGLLGLMPLALLTGTTLDLGKFLAGLLGLTLLLAAVAAVGLLLSALIHQPAAAAAGTFGLLLLLWVADAGAPAGSALAWISLSHHLQPFLRGLVDTADIGYYLIVTVTCLLLSARRLEGGRRG